jgi:hypothetical protein
MGDKNIDWWLFEFEFIYILQILSRLVSLDTEQVKGLHTLVSWYI